MGDRAGEQVRMLAGCLVVGLAWSGGMLPGMGCVLVLGTDSLLLGSQGHMVDWLLLGLVGSNWLVGQGQRGCWLVVGSRCWMAGCCWQPISKEGDCNLASQGATGNCVRWRPGVAV